ncbi:hypothetical protein [Sandarakinorhabdus glacialis]|uniref:hypothetical protein n=1 Tax=Sandarakinorhabdus glacialis TaxID=1614636 RepID=UPI00166C762D|nr:hypothetical protein [Polymorphobacter glacialis]
MSVIFWRAKDRYSVAMPTVPPCPANCSCGSASPYIVLLKRDATLVIVGALEPIAPIDNQQVAIHWRSIAGSLIGSIRETQEVLDFCTAQSIAPEIELIPIQQVNDSYKQVAEGEVRFRYFINMASLKERPSGVGCVTGGVALRGFIGAITVVGLRALFRTR